MDASVVTWTVEEVLQRRVVHSRRRCHRSKRKSRPQELVFLSRSLPPHVAKADAAQTHYNSSLRLVRSNAKQTLCRNRRKSCTLCRRPFFNRLPRQCAAKHSPIVATSASNLCQGAPRLSLGF